MESYIDDDPNRQLTPTPGLETIGNGEALSDFLGSQRQRLFHQALRVLGNNEEAEDALQEGLLAAFCNLHSFKGRARLSTWLTRIVINSARMRRRALRAREWQSIDGPITWRDETPVPARLVDMYPNPEEAFLRTEQRRILKQGLRGLSRRYRRAVSLQVFHDMTPKEAALALGLPVGTVKSQLHRGRRKLLQQVLRIQGRLSARSRGPFRKAA